MSERKALWHSADLQPRFAPLEKHSSDWSAVVFSFSSLSDVQQLFFQQTVSTGKIDVHLIKHVRSLHVHSWPKHSNWITEENIIVFIHMSKNKKSSSAYGQGFFFDSFGCQFSVSKQGHNSKIYPTLHPQQTHSYSLNLINPLKSL